MPALDVEDERIAAFSELLTHARRGNERDAWHRRRHVPQRVQLLVSGRERRGLSHDARADVGKHADEFVNRQVDAETRDGLELVERAAGVTEPPPRHLRQDDPAGSHDRGEHN